MKDAKFSSPETRGAGLDRYATKLNRVVIGTGQMEVQRKWLRQVFVQLQMDDVKSPTALALEGKGLA